jgi:hypothetical protein
MKWRLASALASAADFELGSVVVTMSKDRQNEAGQFADPVSELRP